MTECICGGGYTACEDGHAINCPASFQYEAGMRWLNERRGDPLPALLERVQMERARAKDWEPHIQTLLDDVLVALSAGATTRLVRRDYLAPDGHRPYTAVFHDTDDKIVDTHRLFASSWKDGIKLPGLLSAAGIENGDEFVLTVRKTGERPFGDREVLLVADGTYRCETDAQIDFRAAQGRAWNYRTDASLDV